MLELGYNPEEAEEESGMAPDGREVLNPPPVRLEMMPGTDCTETGLSADEEVIAGAVELPIDPSELELVIVRVVKSVTCKVLVT